MVLTIRDQTYEVGPYIRRFPDATQAIWLIAEHFHGFLVQQVGDIVPLDGVPYIVRQIIEAQATRPNDPESKFIIGDQTVTSTELFHRLDQPDTLVLQTCIARDSEANWGRRFVVCEAA